MHIDELIETLVTNQITTTNTNKVCLSLTDHWAQGRTVFGGISAGLAYLCCKPLIDDDRVLRSFTVNFVGPLLFDTDFDIVAQTLRTGKNVSHFSIQIIQNGHICLMAQACFGVGRNSAISVANNDTHTMEKPRKANFMPQIPKVTPRFLRHFELAIQQGSFPFTRSKQARYQGWMRFKQPPKIIADIHLITLIDAWPPTLLQMLKWPAPASTVSWNLEFIHPQTEVKPDDWFGYQAITRQAGKGYGHTEANIWNADGKLIAISRQTVAVFD